jgi:sterol desaturase/sphingolipid hydroxylase (fatty acid hydroxylase superfamily)
MPINKFLYYGDFFAIPGVLAVFAWLAFGKSGLAGAPAFVSGLAGGLVIWTLAEYWIHRTLYHRTPWFSEFHHLHHEAPKAFIGVPSFVSLGIVILIAYTPFFLFWPAFADGIVSGALIGYAAYMLVHHATHHWKLEPGDWLYPARVRHMSHHYHDDRNFGIITGFWDHVFGTAGRPRRRVAGV